MDLLRSAPPAGTSGGQDNPRARALRILHPKLTDQIRMLDHLGYMLQHHGGRESWPEFLTHYQLIHSKMASLLEALLSPTGGASFLRAMTVVPRSAPPQAPVPIMLSNEVTPEMIAAARESLDRAEYVPNYDASFQLDRALSDLAALSSAAAHLSGPPDSSSAPGSIVIRRPTLKRKGPGDAPGGSDASAIPVLAPRSKLRREIADVSLPPARQPPVIGQIPRDVATGPMAAVAKRVPGSHVLDAPRQQQLARVLRLVQD